VTFAISPWAQVCGVAGNAIERSPSAFFCSHEAPSSVA
jgi:hypothetical protein